MATQYKTRCPHCAAQFKITDEHLKQARGAVRCGSCLQIFQANDYLVDPPTPQQAAPQDRWAGALDGSHSDTAPAEDEQKFGDDDGADTDGLNIQGMELSDSFMNLDADDPAGGLGEDFADMQGAGRASHHENADESWAEALLQELEDDEPAASPGATTTPPPAPASNPAPEQPAARKTTDTSQPKQTKPTDTDDDDDSLFGGLDLFGDDLYEEPVPIGKPVRERDTHFRQRRDWGGLAKWTSLSVVALVVLVGQYAFFNFDDLARSPQWRPMYQQACDVLGCQLPSRSDITQLRGANLVVRSHPDYANALIVDAILFNEAKYPQPFPELELSFSALNGGPVASRRFTPQEYLQGDLLGMETMPTRTPLHISLEIVDPGDKAVNYNLRLLPAPQPRDQVSQR
ncbi:zinc-ribbon and DUF3426 domain-containing protein [Alcanivorax sp.]|uniref:zinc-ribbon and DUF3426 domain-containing protein n=1 Tax=Alcanivorax sp. TaxID=1872427 RepID=UPI002B26D8BB|nr:zinc-ribbon and DUF3426 domain-containing protein [Alcanivorax sp.]